MPAPSERHPRNPQRRRCLVTGGAGFIGSHLCDALLARGDEVVVVDDFSTGRAANLDGARAASPGALSLIEGALGTVLTRELADERFDIVFHLAAAVGVKRIIDRPIESIETNVVDTAALLRYASEHGARGEERGGPAVTLIASSSEVYGKGVRTPFAESDDVLYGPTTAWRWSYAASKAIDEYLALAWHAQRGLPVVITRFFNTVGPRQVGDYGMVLPAFVKAALEGRELHVYGDGTQSRCFCDVRDVVPALLRLVDCPAAMGHVVNVGGDQPVSIRDLAELVVKTLRSRSSIQPIPYDRAYGQGFEDLQRRQPDLTKVRELIGFAPSIPLDQTILDLARELAPT
ncbi:MAG: NAD-dependent epimerase/dehydratase family protein [Phycisphaerales bacterium]